MVSELKKKVIIIGFTIYMTIKYCEDKAFIIWPVILSFLISQ